MDEIQQADAAKADADKVWPRVVEGIVAAEALKPEAVLKELALTMAKNADLIATASQLKDSFSGFDATTLAKLGAAKNVIEQAGETAECLGFLTEQFRRVLVAKNYAK